MTRDIETSTHRSEATTANGSVTPGSLLFAAIAVLVGVAFWFWLTDATSIVSASDPIGQFNSSALAQVDNQDIPDALKTMGGLPSFLDRFKQKDAGCPAPLAWVSIERTVGQATGTVRLRSGNYLSPPFSLTETPVRIAIPYPAPYEAGTGELAIVGTGAPATISLTPTWSVSYDQNNAAVHNVHWLPAKQCGGTNG